MNTKTNAFTLIELLIVIVLIGIVVSFVVPSFGRYQSRTRLIQAHTAVQTELEELFSAARAQPESFAITFRETDGFFGVCRPHDNGLIGTEDCLGDQRDFAQGVDIQRFRKGNNYAKAATFVVDDNLFNGSTPIRVKMVFDPPYGDIRFLEDGTGAFAGVEQDYYEFCLRNESPLHSYFRIWNTGLVESSLDKKIIIIAEPDGSQPDGVRERETTPQDYCL